MNSFQIIKNAYLSDKKDIISNLLSKLLINNALSNDDS